MPSNSKLISFYPEKQCTALIDVYKILRLMEDVNVNLLNNTLHQACQRYVILQAYCSDRPRKF